jgi:hypothetical protein
MIQDLGTDPCGKHDRVARSRDARDAQIAPPAARTVVQGRNEIDTKEIEYVNCLASLS